MYTEIIDYDEHIRLAKEALKRDLAHTEEVYAQTIADLEEANKKQEERIAYEKRLKFSVREDGTQYRVATEKMMDYARSIQSAMLVRGAKSFDPSCPDNVELLEDFMKRMKCAEGDDFNMVKTYIAKHAGDAKRIWDANKKQWQHQKEEDYKHSYQYELDQKQKAWEEEERKREEERRRYDESHRIYDSEGGYYCTGFGSNGMYVDKFGES